MINVFIAILVVMLSGNILLWFVIKNLKRNVVSLKNENAKQKALQLDKNLEYQKLHRSCVEADLLSRIVKQSSNAIMIMDKDGNIIITNKGFSEMYEYTFREFIDTLGNNYRQTSFNSNVEQRINYVIETKSPIRYEALNITKTGKQLWTQTALIPILNKEGEVSHLVTIDTDIDQRVTKSDLLVEEMVQLNKNIDQLGQQFKHLDIDFGNLFQSILELYQLIDKTGEILTFIKYISDETRVLGFNATIEAAKAGQHGTGFHVITNEIIDISHQTINSVGQINHIVNSIKLKQAELIERKDDSKNIITDYQEIINGVKNEVIAIEKSIEEFKTLS
jgi:PAS domain S-box-containing protein